MADKDDEPPAPQGRGIFDEMFTDLFAPKRTAAQNADARDQERARREAQEAADTRASAAERRANWQVGTQFVAKIDLDEQIQPLIDKRVRELLAELVVKPLNEVREALRSSNTKYGIKMLDDVVTALENATPGKEPDKP